MAGTPERGHQSWLRHRQLVIGKRSPEYQALRSAGLAGPGTTTPRIDHSARAGSGEDAGSHCRRRAATNNSTRLSPSRASGRGRTPSVGPRRTSGTRPHGSESPGPFPNGSMGHPLPFESSHPPQPITGQWAEESPGRWAPVDDRRWGMREEDAQVRHQRDTGPTPVTPPVTPAPPRTWAVGGDGLWSPPLEPGTLAGCRSAPRARPQPTAGPLSPSSPLPHLEPPPLSPPLTGQPRRIGQPSEAEARPNRPPSRLRSPGHHLFLPPSRLRCPGSYLLLREGRCGFRF